LNANVCAIHARNEGEKKSRDRSLYLVVLATSGKRVVERESGGGEGERGDGRK